MARFLLLAHTQPARPPIPLNDLPGAGGRWDLLARCIANALLVSHGIRKDAEIRIVFTGPDGPRTLRIDGATVRGLNPDERSTAALCAAALEPKDVAKHESSSRPGFHVSARTFEENLVELESRGPLVALAEDAPQALASWTPSKGEPTFILGDHHDPTPAEHELIARFAAQRLTLGPLALQADQCIAIVHNRLDNSKMG